MNPLLKRQQEAGKNPHGKKSEQRLAKSLGARLTPASGATARSKGDMRVGKVLMEAKSTTARTMALEHDWLVKIENEALEKNCTPALAVSFVTPEGKALPRGEWVAVPRWVYDDLMENNKNGATGMAE